MSARTIAQPIRYTEKLSRKFLDYFVSWNRDKWVNGRPVLINGDVWCPMCEVWHANNTLCQQ